MIVVLLSNRKSLLIYQVKNSYYKLDEYHQKKMGNFTVRNFEVEQFESVEACRDFDIYNTHNGHYLSVRM